MFKGSSHCQRVLVCKCFFLVVNFIILFIIIAYTQEESLEANELCAVKYFHRPIILDVDVEKPLANDQSDDPFTVVFSLFVDNEKLFLEALSRLLGATVSGPYSRSDRPLLICAKPSGPKYEAAIKWGKIKFRWQLNSF